MGRGAGKKWSVVARSIFLLTQAVIPDIGVSLSSFFPNPSTLAFTLLRDWRNR